MVTGTITTTITLKIIIIMEMYNKILELTTSISQEDLTCSTKIIYKCNTFNQCKDTNNNTNSNKVKIMIIIITIITTTILKIKIMKTLTMVNFCIFNLLNIIILIIFF